MNNQVLTIYRKSQKKLKEAETTKLIEADSFWPAFHTMFK